MGRPRLHRIAAGLFAFVFLAATAPGARAQDAAATLVLERQTPFGAFGQAAGKGADPVTTIEVDVRATNTGSAPVGDLSVRLTLGAAVRTRNDYTAAMQPGGPLTALSTSTRPQDGTLEAGASRTFSVLLDLSTLAFVSRAESLIYPLRVDLLSGDTPLAELRTPVPVLVRRPQVPIAFTLVVELSPPVGFSPSGDLADAATETALAPGGRIAEQLAALALLSDSDTPVNLVLSPVLVDTLQRMASGYRIGDRQVAAGQGGAADAAAALGLLRRIVHAPSVETSAYPFAAPQIPALQHSDLGHDLDAQDAAGRALLDDALGATPQTAVGRAPGGALDQGAVQQLANDGAGVLLADADTVERPVVPPQDFAPLPTAALDRPGGGEPIALVLPDPGVQAIVGSELAANDPVLAAQQAFGAMAAVWQERPSVPRGLSVSLTDDLALPATFWQPFARRVTAATFLTPVPADELVQRVPPGDPVPLVAPATTAFSAEYAGRIKQERRRVDALASMLATPDPVTGPLDRALLYAEAGQYVGDEAHGQAWLGAVHAQTDAAFARTLPDASPGFTLTSRSATIPILLGGSPGPPLNVTVELQSAQLRFPDGATQPVRITSDRQSLQFRVEATGAGQIPLRVIVHAPNGRILNETTLVVRSTAYNRIALVITVAAALALVALWVRRLIARRRTT